jgi:hypothetical protein
VALAYIAAERICWMAADRINLKKSHSDTVSQTDDDESLAVAAQDNSTAFAELYQRNQHRAYRYVLVRVGNVPDAEDLTAQIFTAALDNISAQASREQQYKCQQVVASSGQQLPGQTFRNRLPTRHSACSASISSRKVRMIISVHGGLTNLPVTGTRSSW